MAEVPFRLKLTGDLADRHAFEAYDGYIALAGFARTLTLVANYVEEGKIRQRGDFTGRHSVIAMAPSEGSVVADFLVRLQSDPLATFKFATGSATDLVNGLAQRVIRRNLGDRSEPSNDATAALINRRAGDVEALVAIAETPIRQTHSVIGHGATKIEVSGGYNLIAKFDQGSKDYVNLSVEVDEKKERVVSVAAFNVNSGYGSVFDFDLGRTVPISMSRDTLKQLSRIFTWGLDQYSNGTGKNIVIEFTRTLAMDGTPKRYNILKDYKNASSGI